MVGRLEASWTEYRKLCLELQPLPPCALVEVSHSLPCWFLLRPLLRLIVLPWMPTTVFFLCPLLLCLVLPCRPPLPSPPLPFRSIYLVGRSFSYALSAFTPSMCPNGIAGVQDDTVVSPQLVATPSLNSQHLQALGLGI